jgi:hypothetical protein
VDEVIRLVPSEVGADLKSPLRTAMRDDRALPPTRGAVSIAPPTSGLMWNFQPARLPTAMAM